MISNAGAHLFLDSILLLKSGRLYSGTIQLLVTPLCNKALLFALALI